MPKILINEKDNTSAGASGSYANFAVLVAGYAGKALTGLAENDTEFGPDSNGAFEFTSPDDFKDVIGLKAPEITVGSAKIYHYGNQMAYELLKLGYPIIYKPITDVDVLKEANTWEAFKDKAAYDFRFITHGLLESSDTSKIEGYDANEADITVLENVIDDLNTIDTNFIIEKGKEGNQDLEEASWKLKAYADKYKDYEATLKNTLLKDFNTYAKARAFTTDAKGQTVIDKNHGVAHKLTELENKSAALSKGIITKSLIDGANICIANLAKYVVLDSKSREIPGRGDCVALIELDETAYTKNTTGEAVEDRIITAINDGNLTNIDNDNGKYCAMTVPSVYYKLPYDEDKKFNNNTKFPGAFHYLACFINAQKQGFAEWYAVAGYTRGVSSFIIDHTSVKLGEMAINALEPRYLLDQKADPKFACNVIANFRGNYYLWGNRTAFPLYAQDHAKYGNLTASSFLNIRQLCSTIKKQLYVACRKFTFDPNSDTLWINFCNAIRPTLDAMKADQGIRDYKIVRVQEANPAKATLKAKIRIIPIEAVEDFDLEVSLEDSFGETAAVVTE